MNRIYAMTQPLRSAGEVCWGPEAGAAAALYEKETRDRGDRRARSGLQPLGLQCWGESGAGMATPHEKGGRDRGDCGARSGLEPLALQSVAETGDRGAELPSALVLHTRSTAFW